MSKNKVLKFKETTAEEDFYSFLRQINSFAILNSIYEISKSIYFGGCTINNLTKHVRERDPRSLKIIEQDVIIQPWQFPDLAYGAIKYSNEYRGIDTMTSNMFLMVLCLTNSYLSAKTKEYLETNNISSSTPFDLLLYTYGFAGEQFRYQSPRLFFIKMIRELYIVFSISQKCNSEVNPDQIIKEETGLEWKDLMKGLFGIFIDSLLNNSIHPSFAKIEFGEGKSKEEVFEKIKNYYSFDYDDIRTHPLKRQVFYIRPFVKTQRNGLCSVSVYFNQFIVEHAPFWVLRSYYQKKPKKQSQIFTDEFGVWFEKYFSELCSAFSIDKTRISEDGRKRADWKLEMSGYSFLVEQKSAIVQLSVKQQLSDYFAYKSAIQKTVYKAISQLNETEIDLKIKNPIKFILCYDDYINPDILPSIFTEADCPVNDDHRYFIVNILEMEMFFSLYSTNKNLFEIVVKDMLSRNANGTNDGISLLKIMRDNNFDINLYWTSPIFDEYKNLLRDIKNSHCDFKEID